MRCFRHCNDYQLDPADSVKSIVTAGAGVSGAGGGGGGGGGGETAPLAPSNLSAAGSKRAVTINWTDNPANEAQFKIERSTDGATSPRRSEPM